MPKQFNAGPPIGPVASKDELVAALESLPWDDTRKASVMDRYAAWEAGDTKPDKPEKPTAGQAMGAFFKRVMGDK